MDNIKPHAKWMKKKRKKKITRDPIAQMTIFFSLAFICFHHCVYICEWWFITHWGDFFQLNLVKQKKLLWNARIMRLSNQDVSCFLCAFFVSRCSIEVLRRGWYVYTRTLLYILNDNLYRNGELKIWLTLKWLHLHLFISSPAIHIHRRLYL